MKPAHDTSTRIPKRIHRIWFGPEPIPERYQDWWSAWRRQYPDFEFRTWRDADISSLNVTAGKIREADGYARKADIARYEILHEFGGIYLDCDMQPWERFDFEHERADLVVCNETDDMQYCSIGFLAARKGHPVFRGAIDEILATPLNQLPANRETGPWLFGRVLAGHASKRLPPMAFYPYHYGESRSSIYTRSLKATYGIHAWAGSYLDADWRVDSVASALRTLNPAELGALAPGLDSPQKNELEEFIRGSRVARQSVFRCAALPLWGDLPEVRDTEPFELPKLLDFLLTTQPDAVIWQVGAADGILVDPLRPSMVQHNPRAVLFEPNPWLFKCLQKNYRLNDQAQLIPCALASKPGKLTLNAIEPQVARALALPEWVDGISSVYTDRNAIGGKTIGPELTAEIQRCIRRVDVEVLDIAQARSLSVHGDPDVLVVDVEGMDAEVIHAALDQGMKPEIIQFETQCLPAREAEAFEERLSKDHTIIRFGNDAVALRREFLLRYAEALYVEQGLPTIMRDRMVAVLQGTSGERDR
ncbi:MAG: FkbM family methyltransferase [Xanthomonadales bacterium]|jgi:FkbM family methyltransferase|nr:FkbM family methyltransferase [Xanthomonadales bacterium]